MNKHPIWYLIIGIFILVAPTVIYLGFLIPQLTEAYNVLMASGGVIGGAGFYAASKIPEKLKYIQCAHSHKSRNVQSIPTTSALYP